MKSSKPSSNKFTILILNLAQAGKGLPKNQPLRKGDKGKGKGKKGKDEAKNQTPKG